MQVKIGKQYEFAAAHMLPGHKGKCANLHGHNYKVEIWVKWGVVDAPGASDDAMVVDFANLDEAMRPIMEDLDHATLTDGFNDMTLPITKVYCLHARTTAENLAIHIHQRLAQCSIVPGGALMGVVVWETPKAYAEYINVVSPRSGDEAATLYGR